jgi:hypothetical protein
MAVALSGHIVRFPSGEHAGKAALARLFLLTGILACRFGASPHAEMPIYTEGYQRCDACNQKNQTGDFR